MHPILAQMGPFTLYTYGLCFAAAVLLGMWVAERHVRREAHFPLTAAAFSDLMLVIVLGGIVGGRLLYVALNWSVYAAQPWEIIALWHGGLVFYGGLAGGLAAAVWYLRRQLQAVGRWGILTAWQVVDALMPSLALAQSVGRIGCFFNGCCYGRPTTGWWGVRFPGVAEPLYPTQLMESFGTLCVFVVLRLLQDHSARRGGAARPGLLTGAYLVLYGSLRFGIEFLRGDNPRWLWGLTLSQWIGVAAAPIGLGLLAWQRRHVQRGQ